MVLTYFGKRFIHKIVKLFRNYGGKFVHTETTVEEAGPFLPMAPFCPNIRPPLLSMKIPE